MKTTVCTFVQFLERFSVKPFYLHSEVVEKFSTSGKDQNFFGYYGLSPLNLSGTKMLSHQIDFKSRDNIDGDVAGIGYWDLETGEFNKLAETRAFNLQQGSMLQWMPPEYDFKLIYNDIRDGRFVSIILDIEKGLEEIIPHSIYAIHPSGKFALGSNNERLYFCRPGYRYFGVVDDKWDVPIHDEDGIFKVDLMTKEVELMVPLKGIVNNEYKSIMKDGHNFLEIFIWNPSGTRFAFLHRWLVDGENVTRLYTADADGKDRYLFPDTGFYSHMGWLNDEVFTIWAIKPSISSSAINFVSSHGFLRKTIGPLYRFIKDKFFKKLDSVVLPEFGYLNMTDKTEKVEVVGKGVLNEDGHNTWTRDGRYMLTDTYDDKDGYRHLLLYDSKDDCLKEIGSFYSPYNDCGYRCDLHPRFDHSENLVVIDSAHDDGKRQMYVYDISKLKN